MQIERRHRLYYALLGIPRDCQKALGTPDRPKVRFVQSLKTSDLPTARIRAATLEAQWLTAIERARGTGKYLEDEAAFYREALTNAPTPERRREIEEVIHAKADELNEAEGGDPFGHPNREVVPAAARFYAKAHGNLVEFTEHMDVYLNGLKLTAKSVAMARTTLEAFAPGFPTVADVTRKAVQTWATKQVEDKSPTTVRRTLSELRGYWRYLQSVEAAPDNLNPFTQIILPRRDKNAKADDRRPFSVADVLTLRETARKHKDWMLVDLIDIARWTGCRIKEICSLRIERVHLKSSYIEITDAKTAAGWRQVPIHSLLKATLKRLVKASKDGFVLSGLAPDQYGDRAGAVSQRFSLMKTALGFDQRQTFHSIRRTVATLLENAGVQEGIASDILGHRKRSMSYGLYSGGTSLKRKRAAIEKIRY